MTESQPSVARNYLSVVTNSSSTDIHHFAEHIPSISESEHYSRIRYTSDYNKNCNDDYLEPSDVSATYSEIPSRIEVFEYESTGPCNDDHAYQKIPHKTVCSSTRRKCFKLGIVAIIFVVIAASIGISVIFLDKDINEYDNTVRYYVTFGRFTIFNSSLEMSNGVFDANNFCSTLGSFIVNCSRFRDNYRFCRIQDIRTSESIVVESQLYFDPDIVLKNEELSQDIKNCNKDGLSNIRMGSFVIERNSLTLNTLLAVFEKDPLSFDSHEKSDEMTISQSSTQSTLFHTSEVPTFVEEADVRVFRITAIVGESTTTQACVISPDGEWLHVELSIDYNSSSHVIAKLDHNKTFEKPTFVDRFNGSININGNDIVVRLTVDLTSPKPDSCTWDGRYFMRCSVTINDTMQTKKSNGSRISITGAAPTLIVNPDIYERFTRQGLNHICKTVHTGGIQSEKYLEIQVYRPNHTTGFRYSKKIPESEKEFNSENNITYINITGSTARFLLVSDFTSNNSCNNIQTITFLLDRPIEFDKGIVKCVLRDDNFEYASAAENISVIPDEYCFGYEDIPKRNHPNNDCFYFVNCFEDGGRMYAIGDSCRTPGTCMDFSLGYCVDCHENFTCKGPEPVATTTTLAPGKTYVQCSDVSQKEGLPIIINCTVLDDTFQSLIVTLTSSSNGNKEKKMGVILPDGTIQNQARSSPVLNTTFSVGSKYIHFVIGSSSCMEEGEYSLTNTNVSMDTQPSISAFFFDNLVPVKELTINSESLYKEGKPLIFNCMATVDSDHTELLGYYKVPSDNSYVKVQGEQTILQTFTQNCTKSVISRFDTGLLVSANLNGTKLKCLYNEISPEVSEEGNVQIQSADVAFNTYKLKAEAQSKANFTCLIRSTGFYKAIKILKIINSTSMIEMASYTSSSDSVQSVAGVDANFSSNALTLMFASVMCSDEGQYNCTVIMDDDSEQQPPLSLDVQVTTSPGSSSVELFVDPNIVEDRDSGTHNCLGSVGYPEVGGHLEITFVHPLINYNITLNKNSSRTILGNEIKIKSTLEPFTKDECKNMEKISFTINSTKNWNKGKIICEVKTQNGSVQKATKDDIFYVIDGSFCNSTNNQEIYFDHEKEDFCNTYIQCSRGKPFGRFCKPNWCVYIGRTYCDDCSTAVCSERVTTTEVTLSSFETTPVPVPRSLHCTSPSVYEGESATIPCSLNVSSFDFISISNDKGMIMSIFENTTVIYFGDSSSTFQGSLTGKTVIFIVKNLNCNNSLDYVFKLYNGGEVSSSVTANPLMKVKPITPVLNIDYRLEMGKNQNFHTCKGYVGNPKGSLELEIRNGSLATYNKYIPNTQSFDTMVYENCNHYLTLTFSIDLTKDNLTGQHIRCLAKNIESLENTDPIPTSNEVLIIPIPANPCSKGNGDYPHPRDCYHYLQCSNNIAYTQICPGGGCFNDTAKACL